MQPGLTGANGLICKCICHSIPSTGRNLYSTLAVNIYRLPISHIKISNRPGTMREVDSVSESKGQAPRNGHSEEQMRFENTDSRIKNRHALVSDLLLIKLTVLSFLQHFLGKRKRQPRTGHCHRRACCVHPVQPLAKIQQYRQRRRLKLWRHFLQVLPQASQHPERAGI